MTSLLAAKAIQTEVELQKGLSMKEVKRIVATALGIQRVHSKKLKPVLELGYSERLFSLEENRIVPYLFVPVSAEWLRPRFALMSRSAQKYYAQAVEISPVYVNQVEHYLDYCIACKENGIDPVHPKKWVCGDIADSGES